MSIQSHVQPLTKSYVRKVSIDESILITLSFSSIYKLQITPPPLPPPISSAIMLFSRTFIPEFIYLFAKINFPFSLIYAADIYACIVTSNAVYANFVAFM